MLTLNCKLDTKNQNGRQRFLNDVPVDVDCALEAAAQLVDARATVVDVEDANDGAFLRRSGDAAAAGGEGDCHQVGRVSRDHRLGRL